ncbi:GGDEF domain-containing protein [Sulfurospirillum arcachonense]|uniref:GGDEF domain-containing protein n=1 Tax=Sulfurospirillum arcachonense TaxID=57666 RepID=UPI00046A641F|nr:GGDEF domain-containing protein [Sulfurospirillum arcachonense]
MLENKLFEALLDVIPFRAYAVDVESYEIIYANKMVRDNMYAPQETYCWEKLYGKTEKCSWCSIDDLKARDKFTDSKKFSCEFFDELDDRWLNSFDELINWPDGRYVKYSILIDTTEQKEAQGSMLKSHASLAVRTKQVKKTNKNLQITKLRLQKTINKLQKQEEELKLLASTDPLTKLFNRRYFTEVSGHILDLAKRNNENMSIIMLDIDKFKNINDTYGHKVGDDTLVVFAETLNNFKRKSDVVCRFGGEEFVILLPETNVEGASKIAHKIRKVIEELIIKIDEKIELNFTVSVGVSQVNIEKDNNIEAAINRADKALYQAKDTGRNKTVVIEDI